MITLLACNCTHLRWTASVGEGQNKGSPSYLSSVLIWSYVAFSHYSLEFSCQNAVTPAHTHELCTHLTLPLSATEWLCLHVWKCVWFKSWSDIVLFKGHLIFLFLLLHFSYWSLFIWLLCLNIFILLFIYIYIVLLLLGLVQQKCTKYIHPFHVKTEVAAWWSNGQFNVLRFETYSISYIKHLYLILHTINMLFFKRHLIIKWRKLDNYRDAPYKNENPLI